MKIEIKSSVDGSNRPRCISIMLTVLICGGDTVHVITITSFLPKELEFLLLFLFGFDEHG